MLWITPSEKDLASDALEKRLWNFADQFRANFGLTAAQYSVAQSTAGGIARLGLAGKIKMNLFRLSLNLFRRDWRAGEWRVLLLAVVSLSLPWACSPTACGRPCNSRHRV